MTFTRLSVVYTVRQTAAFLAFLALGMAVASIVI